MRGYRTIAYFSALAGVGAFGLLVLASFDYLSDLRFAGVSLWPLVVGVMLLSIFVGCWAIAKAKGISEWLGLVLPFLDIIGLAVLFKLEDRVLRRKRGKAKKNQERLLRQINLVGLNPPTERKRRMSESERLSLPVHPSP